MSSIFCQFLGFLMRSLSKIVLICQFHYLGKYRSGFTVRTMLKVQLLHLLRKPALHLSQKLNYFRPRAPKLGSEPLPSDRLRSKLPTSGSELLGSVFLRASRIPGISSTLGLYPCPPPKQTEPLGGVLSFCLECFLKYYYYFFMSYEGLW